MPVSNYNITTIQQNECLSDSLSKINNNFNNLEDAVCELKQRVDKLVSVRTFFYYGPNAATTPGSGMDNNSTTRPSNQTIEAFVNSSTQLNLPAMSFKDDIAYVIYQKTGYYTNAPGTPDINTQSQIQRRRVISRTEEVPYYQDIGTFFAPIFVIWRLTYNGSTYTVDLGFPKFSQAQTTNTGVFNANWNNPQTWTTF